MPALALALAVTVPASAGAARAGQPGSTRSDPASSAEEHHHHHSGVGGHTDGHAARDLVGVPVERIVRATYRNARRIAAVTGVRPGRRAPGTTAAGDLASSAAAVDAGVGGAWSTVSPTPVVPIEVALLPDGNVLMWDSVGTNPAESYSDHDFTRAAVWDPVTNSATRVDVPGYNLFCSGFVQLADGRVLVAGGNRSSLNGIRQTHLFDWRTRTWSRGPDMAAERWYPSVLALANGEAVIVGGGPSTAEVHQTDGRLRRLTGFSSYAERQYGFLTLRPDGNVSLLGPPPRMQTFSTGAGGALLGQPSRGDGIRRTYGSFATFDRGKAIVAGGGAIKSGTALVPTKTAVVVDMAGSGSVVRATSPMSIGRRQHNLTVLADGSVLATGGQSRAEEPFVDLQNPVFAAERWDPATGTWTVLASAARVREYHSSALLLPDGRVMTGGGGICAECRKVGYLESNVEYFSPPYLFSKDGSGRPAARPVITTAPSTVRYGATFSVESPQAGSIAKVGLVRLGAATHSGDKGQRYVALAFTRSPTGVTPKVPVAAAAAPPGYYMLFLVDAQGVPSVAKTVRVTG